MSKSDQTNQTKGQTPDDLMEYLYADLIYRFNQMFIQAWKQGNIGYIDGKKTAFFTLSYFNSHTRTFNWISVAGELWDHTYEEWDSTVEDLTGILKRWNNNNDETEFRTSKYCERKKTWEGLWKDFPKGGIYNIAEEICESLEFDGESRERLQRAMLGLYSGIYFEAEKNIEGIFVGYLKALEKPVGRTNRRIT